MSTDLKLLQTKRKREREKEREKKRERKKEREQERESKRAKERERGGGGVGYKDRRRENTPARDTPFVFLILLCFTVVLIIACWLHLEKQMIECVSGSVGEKVGNTSLNMLSINRWKKPKITYLKRWSDASFKNVVRCFLWERKVLQCTIRMEV